MRADLEIIRPWISDNSRVLDLGCGDGAFLAQLKKDSNISGYGLEIDPEKINKCLSAGVDVIEQNLDNGLANFDSNSFDTVVLAQTLQAVQKPDLVIDEMLRIGKSGIISFPNFAHWKHRLYLMKKGRMPVSKYLPNEWYNTPNIHLCTIKDFDQLCKDKNIKIITKTIVNHHYKNSALMDFNPNFFGINAIYHISR